MFEKLWKNPRKNEQPTTEFQRVIKQLENNQLDTLQFDSQHGRENLGSEEVQILATALPKCPRLVKLVLREHGFGDSGAQALAEALPHVKLVHLEIIGNDIGEAGMRALASAIPKCPTLRYLVFYGNKDSSGLLENEIENLLSKNRARGNNVIDAATDGNLDELQMVFLHGASVWYRKWDHIKGLAPEIARRCPSYNTPLHLAAMNGHVAVARFLVENGAPLDAEDGDGKTPAQVARSPEMIALLEELAKSKETLQAWVEKNPIQLQGEDQPAQKGTFFGLLQKRRTSSLSVSSSSKIRVAEKSSTPSTTKNNDSLASINEEKKVEELYERGEYHAAIEASSKIIKKDPSHELAWRYQGASKRMLGLYADAIIDLSKAIKLNPRNCFSWERRAATFLELARNEEAIEDCNQVIGLNRKSDFAWSCRGNAKKKLGRYFDAAADFSETLRLNPINDFAKQSMNEINESIKSLKFCDSHSTSVLINVKNKVECETALSACRRAIESNPSEASAWENRALLRRELKQFEEAIQDFNEVIKINPSRDFAWAHRAALKIILKRNEEALHDLTEALRLNPENGFAWATRGIAHNDVGHYKEAISDLEQALALAPHCLHHTDKSKVSELLETIKRKLFPQPPAARQASESRPLPSAPALTATLVPPPADPYLNASAPSLTTVLSAPVAPFAPSAPQMSEQTQVILREAAKPPHINFKKITLDKKPLASGGMGVVYRGIFKNPKNQKQVVAVKMLTTFKGINDVSIEALKKEYDILGTLCHPNVVNIVGYSNNESGFCLVMDFYPNGSLNQYIYTTGKKPFEWRLRCGKEISEGLDFLHKRNVLHLDLKPENIFVREDWHVVIGDFGISRTLQTNHGQQTTNSSAMGTVAFVAPEIMFSSDADGKTRYSKPNDVFSFIMVLWALVAEKKPYSGMDPFRIIAYVGMERNREKIPPHTPPRLAALINRGWLHDPSARPTAEQVSHELGEIYQADNENSNARQIQTFSVK